MKKIFLPVAFCGFFIMFGIVEASDIRDHPRVAVTNFANKAIVSEELRDQDISLATEYAIFQLSASNMFDLIDYEQMIAIARLHSINMSGLVDTTSAPALGKFAAARFIMVGAVTGLTTKESGLSIGGAGVAAGVSKHTVTANITVRFVDMETGKIVAAGIGTGKSSSALAEISFNPYRNAANWIIPHSTNVNINIGNENHIDTTDGMISSGIDGDYFIKIGTAEISAVQVRNAIGKAVRDAVYGKNGVMTLLNNGKPLDIKTDF